MPTAVKSTTASTLVARLPHFQNWYAEIFQRLLRENARDIPLPLVFDLVHTSRLGCYQVAGLSLASEPILRHPRELQSLILYRARTQQWFPLILFFTDHTTLLSREQPFIAPPNRFSPDTSKPTPFPSVSIRRQILRHLIRSRRR